MEEVAKPKKNSDDVKSEEYRRTHSPEGFMLGSRQYPDNREGRRKLARSWRGKGR